MLDERILNYALVDINRKLRINILSIHSEIECLKNIFQVLMLALFLFILSTKNQIIFNHNSIMR